MILREAGLPDSADLAKIQVDTWRKTYQGIIPSDFLANMMYADAEKHWKERFSQSAGADWFILAAETISGNLAGFVAAGPERGQDRDYSGEVYAIYVLPAYQRQGIGKKLFLESTARLLELGYPTLLVWVLEENPSRGFYANLRGEVVRRRMVEIGGTLLPEVGYGWGDARLLVALRDRQQAA